MSTWNEAIITKKGIALLTKLHSGTTLSLTRAVAGAGSVAHNDLQYQTAVTDERQEMTFSTKSYPEEGTCAIPLRLRNIDVTEEYNVTQIGVYAFDPDEGEILYLIAQASDGVGTNVPTAAEMPTYASVWTFNVLYGQADDVTIVVDPAAAATVEEIQAIIDAHTGDTDNPHDVTAEQLGLGNVDNTRDSVKHVAFASESGEARKLKNSMVIRLNGGRTEGTDQFTFDGSAGKSINVSLAKLGAAPAVESDDYPGCYYRIVDGWTEWINPPMNGDVEYMTTERFQGKPVYTKQIVMNFSGDITTQTTYLYGASNVWVERSRRTATLNVWEDCLSATALTASGPNTQCLTVTCNNSATVITQVKYTK